MAEATTELAKLDQEPSFLPGANHLGLFKQIGLMVAIAASAALGVFLMLWGSDPEMRPLGNTDAESSMEIVSFLEQRKTPYKIDAKGIIHVPQDRYQRIVLELSGQGVTMGNNAADQFLNKDSGFGVSQRMEKARLQRSYEMQLARTIESFSGVRTAKVHLALPKESAFLKHKRQPSASVMLTLYNTRALEDEQVRAIVDLITGSVPNLEKSRVTVTDQLGRLLHSGSQSSQEMETNRELKITRELRNEYLMRVEQILLPIVGEGNFTVQVNVDMDFTKTEQTQQFYNPELPSLRSERILEDESTSGTARGIPGVLSNQPPAQSAIPEQAADQAGGSTGGGAPKNRRVESEKNYDLDTTISHIRPQVGVVQRVSVSVGLDYLTVPVAAAAVDPAADGADAEAASAEPTTQRIPMTDQQVTNILKLIEGAIGYNVQRGDLVEIRSFDFVRPAALPEAEPLPFYEQPLFMALWKPIIALLLGLMLIFGVLKPMMNRLTTPSETMPVSYPEMHDDDDDEDTVDKISKDDLDEPELEEEPIFLPTPDFSPTQKEEHAKSVVSSNPTMVAQLVKKWVEQDEAR